MLNFSCFLFKLYFRQAILICAKCKLTKKCTVSCHAWHILPKKIILHMNVGKEEEGGKRLTMVIWMNTCTVQDPLTLFSSGLDGILITAKYKLCQFFWITVRIPAQGQVTNIYMLMLTWTKSRHVAWCSCCIKTAYKILNWAIKHQTHERSWPWGNLTRGLYHTPPLSCWAEATSTYHGRNTTWMQKQHIKI